MNASLSRLIRTSGVSGARRTLDLALDVLGDAVGDVPRLTAFLHGPGEMRVRSARMEHPQESVLRRPLPRLRKGVGELVVPGTDAPLLAMALDVGDGSSAVAGAAAPPDRRPELAALLPMLLLAMARGALVLGGRRRMAELERLDATAQRVAAFLDLGQVLSEIVGDAVELVGAGSGDIVLRDPDGTRMRVVAAANLPEEIIGFELDEAEGLSRRAMEARRTLVVQDYQRYRYRIRRLDAYGFRAVVSAPLVARGEPIGALNVHTRDPEFRFSRADARLLSTFANHAAVAIDNARRYENEVLLAQNLARANEELSRSLSLQQRLAEQVLLDRGPAAVTRELATLLERPVVVQDHLLRLVAGAAPDGKDWSSLALPQEALGDPALAGTLEQLAATGRVAIAPPDASQGPRRLVAPIRIGRTVSGYLVLPAGEDLAALDRALIEVASTGVALEMAKRSAQIEMEQRLRGDVIADLLSGAFTSPEAMTARAARLGYDLTLPREVLVFEIDDLDSQALDDARQLHLRRRFLDAIDAEVSRRSAGAIVVPHGNYVVVLAAGTDEARPDDSEEARALAEETRAAVAPHLAGMTVSVALGTPCRGPEQYRASYELARRALEATRRLGRRDRVVGARELGVSRLLISASKTDELSAFATRTLGPLLAEGGQARQLLDTLRAYIESGYNQRETARRCFVHVNTVAYRLRRIEGLLGVDLTDSQSLLDVTFALRVADVLDGSLRDSYGATT